MMSMTVASETFTAGARQFTAMQHRRAVAAITKGAIRMKQTAKSKLVWRSSKAGPGGRASGALERSIHDKTVGRPGLIVGTVSTNAEHAQFVEGIPKPPRRHFVPFSIAPGLRQWAKRHNVPARWWGAQAKGMMVGGPKSSTPFMRPAWKERIDSVRHDIERALAA